jgi:anti-sigma regulatory factor (Ser/Thr protein kinase)/PAS domain-containing protein
MQALEVAERKRAEEEVRRLNEELEYRVIERTTQLESANVELISENHERKRVEEALRDSQQLMSNIIDFLPDAIMALDLDGKIIIWNKAMEALTKVRSEDMIGKGNYEHALPFYGFRRPTLIDTVLEPLEGFEAEYFGFQRDKNAVVGEVFIPTFGPRGSYLLKKATRLYDATGKVIGVIESIRDMTDRRVMEQKIERTRAELHIASDIQRSFIPEHPPDVPGFDISAITIPAMEVGGDFYDFIQLTDNKYGVVVADVAGKSVPAAIFMALSRTIIRANVLNQKEISNVLAGANKMIELDTTAGMFVTLLYGVIEKDNLIFRYSNAGHPPPLIFRSAKCAFEKEAPLGIALGVVKDADYAEKVVYLCPGDIVFLYTDGITEAMDKDGDIYGEKRLMDVICNHCQEKASDIIYQILENIKSFTGEVEQQDDLTLVLLKAVNSVEAREEIRISALEKEIPKIVNRIERTMWCLGFSDEDNLSIQLAVDEAIANIITHGYRNIEGYISIILESRPNYFMVTIEDKAPKFDPTRIDKPNLIEDIYERPIGGLGIHIIKSLTDEMRYDYADGKNRLSLIKKK